ncbi:MAG: chemotaxis protein CheW [bacterium]|nr:chemotaxis protein CheW [bacterium]
MSSNPPTDPLKVLIARAGDHWCALPLTQVRRVMTALKLSPLPGASREVAGLAEVDGEPLVVLSLETLIDAPTGPASEHPVTLLVECRPGDSDEVVGLAAEEAGEIVRLDEAAVVGPACDLIRGEAQVEDHLVQVLDLTKLGGEP